MNQIFEGKTTVISGGLGDIGRATAKAFALQGSNVAICDVLPDDQAQTWLSEMDALKVASRYHQVDVSDPDEVHDWLKVVESELGVPSLIIANAATATQKTILEVNPDQWDREIQVNLNGAFYMTQYAAQRLVCHQLPGRVVFVGSWAGHAVHFRLPAYSVSKAAVRMLCKSMALELAPHDILVNEIAPGYVDAGLSGKIWRENPGLKYQSIEKVPIKRVMRAQEVADQIVRLCHPDNNQMTGSTLLMDGGLSLLST